MFAFRRAASRLLTSRATAYASAPRTYTSFASPSSRIAQRAPAFLQQQRWASSGTENDEVPKSEFQPTPQEEVENAIDVDNAKAEAAQSTGAVDAHAPTPIAETANATEATEEDLPADPTLTGAQEDNDAGLFSKRTTGIPQGFEKKPTLYIGNLFFDVTEADLVKELARFGTITKVRIVRDGRGLSKGFGYADFATQEAADAALEALNMQLYEGRRITVQYAARSTSRVDGGTRPDSGPRNAPSSTLFIGNMSFEMSDRDLSQLFRGIRGVTDVRVAIDRRTGQPRGFAHADFVDIKSAAEAMTTLSGKETYGRKLRVDYSYSSSTAPRNKPRDQQAAPGQSGEEAPSS